MGYMITNKYIAEEAIDYIMATKEAFEKGNKAKARIYGFEWEAWELNQIIFMARQAFPITKFLTGRKGGAIITVKNEEEIEEMAAYILRNEII